MNRRGIKSIILAAVLLLIGGAFAQDRWTIQTVAFPDYRLAEAEVARLSAFGLDVYTEFTMLDGSQYTRIRIGCFESRPAAELMADLIAGSLTDEAVVQPFTEGAAPAFCLRNDIGFIKPSEWSVQSQDSQQIVFRVQFGGQTGFVRMRGGQWRLLTALEPADASTATKAVQFEQVTVGGTPALRASISGSDRLVCSGRLIWQAGRTAVVEVGNAVAACTVEPVGPGSPL